MILIKSLIEKKEKRAKLQLITRDFKAKKRDMQGISLTDLANSGVYIYKHTVERLIVGCK